MDGDREAFEKGWIDRDQEGSKKEVRKCVFGECLLGYQMCELNWAVSADHHQSNNKIIPLITSAVSYP